MGMSLAEIFHWWWATLSWWQALLLIAVPAWLISIAVAYHQGKEAEAAMG
jgi:hypothetical protein